MPIKEAAIELGWGLSNRLAVLFGTWEPGTAKRDASWELYAELATSSAIVPLQSGLVILTCGADVLL